MINNELKNKVDALTPTEQDDIYRYLWAKHVKQDVKTKAEEYEDLNPTEEEIENVVRRYVYDCEYDCNLDYWANIEYLLEDETGYRKKYYIPQQEYRNG